MGLSARMSWSDSTKVDTSLSLPRKSLTLTVFLLLGFTLTSWVVVEPSASMQWSFTLAAVAPGFCRHSHSSYLPSMVLSLVVPSAKYQVLERVIVKVTWFESPLEVCTCTGPVVALSGKRAWMARSLHESILAVTPLNVTVLSPCSTPKSCPWIVTSVPYGPESGTNLSMEGAIGVLSLIHISEPTR